jgi:hypothetical protein
MQSIKQLVVAFGSIVKLAIPLVMGIALLGFFWGLALFIFQNGDDKAVEKGKNIMKWGILALFVMTSVWGIIGLLQADLGVGGAGSGIIQIKQI